MKTRAQAPGKLFLLGEYAVLEGAPAALVPVSQQATVSFDSNPEKASQGRVTSIGTDISTLPTSEALEAYPLLAALAAELNLQDQLQAGHLHMDTSEFFAGNQKLGLGSSAALTAALTRLFLPEAEESQRLERAQAVHRRFQGGTGSGADVALSVYRQPIVFQAGKANALNLPDSLHMLAIWTGLAASTVDYVQRMNRWQAKAPDAWSRHLSQLTNTVSAFLSAAADADTHQILATIDQYGRQLSLLSMESGVNFYTETHVAVQKKVESARCVYKPSGAGGGDFGIAFSADKNELITLANEMERENTLAFFLD